MSESYVNDQTGIKELIKGSSGAYYNMQRGTVAEESWSGSANTTQNFPSNRYGFACVNDGTGDLTFTINGQSRTVKAGESYYSLFRAFTSVDIVTTSAYRAEVFS